MFHVAAFRANVKRHVFNNPQHRDVDLLKHAQALFGVKKRNVLRRRNDDGTGHRNRLGERQLNVTGSRGHVNHKVIEVMPGRLVQKLRERLGNQGAAPDHGFARIDHEAHGIDFNTVTHNGFHIDAVKAFRLPACGKHRGLGGPVNVGVQHADLSAFGFKRKGEVCGNRGLTHTALAGTHGNDVFDVGERL